MTFCNISKANTNKLVIISIILISLLISTIPVFGHGGKHAADEFTHLQALQKATEMYDRLIANGKLDQSWETKLIRVNVSNRMKAEKKEIILV